MNRRDKALRPRLQDAIATERRLRDASAPGPPPVFHGDWHGLDFSRADWTGADFHGADLRRADLSGATFKDADLTDARLWNAKLIDADLSGARGLIPGHLAGADLAFARLPAELGKFAGLEYVKDLSGNASKVFLSVLGLAAFVLLTLASSEDAQLFLNNAATKLPVIGVDVPIRSFLFVAPALLLALHLYFHIYLQRLWEALAELPAVFPDGRRLDQATFPWLINDLCRDYLPVTRVHRVLAARAQSLLSLALIYAVVPLTLFLVWAKGLHLQDPLFTGTHVLFFTLGVGLSLGFWRRLKRTFRARLFREGRLPWGTRLLDLVCSGVLPVGLLLTLSFWSHGVFTAENPPSASDLSNQLYVTRNAVFPAHGLPAAFRGYPDSNARELGFWQFWGPRALLTLRLSPYADVRGAAISTKPAGWTGLAERVAIEEPQVRGASWEYRLARHLRADGSFFAKGRFAKVDLTGVSFSRADLRHAQFLFVDARRVEFTWAKLSQAIFLWCNLGDADFNEADLRASAFINSESPSNNRGIACPNFRGANLRYAVFRNCDLSRVVFEDAVLEDADLSTCIGLTVAELKLAQTLRGAKLPPDLAVQLADRVANDSAVPDEPGMLPVPPRKPDAP